MKIYVGHSTAFDFKKELYGPIRKSKFNEENQLIFPHEDSSDTFDSKNELEKIDLMIAEVTFPSTGLGIELGIANIIGIPIICIYKNNAKISSSIARIATKLISYGNAKQLIAKLAIEIDRLKN